MSTATKDESDSSVTFNRSLLFYNSNTNNIQSWLSASLKGQSGTTSAETEQHEEPEIIGDEEEGGLEYTPPVNLLTQDRQGLSVNDRLRKQLLGNRTGNPRRGGTSELHHKTGLSASKPKPHVKRPVLSDSDGEADGRTSTAGKKSKEASGSHNSLPSPRESQDLTPKANSKKRSNNYLDELLAQRQNKKGKSQKNVQSKPT